MLSALPTGPIRWMVIGSLGFLAVLVSILVSRSPRSESRPVIVYCAASQRLPMEALVERFQHESGRRVELRFGASEELLQRVLAGGTADPGDLFLPADESYIREAAKQGRIDDERNFATMDGVLLVNARKPMTRWADLLGPGVKIAVAGEGAAIGRLSRAHLKEAGLWDDLAPHVIETGTVTESANAVQIGSVDAAIVWDAVATHYPSHQIVNLRELAGIRALVTIATLKDSPQPAVARRFLRYVVDAETGLPEFQKRGFKILTEPSVRVEDRP